MVSMGLSRQVLTPGNPADFDCVGIKPSATLPPVQTIGERLRQAREALGLSLREVQARCGVQAQTLSEIERGLRQPRAGTLRRVGDVLRIPREDLQPSFDVRRTTDTSLSLPLHAGDEKDESVLVSARGRRVLSLLTLADETAVRQAIEILEDSAAAMLQARQALRGKVPRSREGSG